MRVEKLLEDASVRTPALDVDRARRSIAERARRRARRRATVVGAGAVILLLIVAVAVVVARPDGDGTVAVITDGTVPTAPEGEAEPGWQSMGDAPIPSRTAHVATSTGDEMVVWGGYTYEGARRHALADGAAYSFDTGEWRPISEAPLDGRGSALAVWTGEEVLVLGGHDADGRSLLDAAAWDPETDEWRQVPIPGLSAAVGPSAAVWAEDQLVLVGVTRSGAEMSGPLEVVGLDVTTGELRELGTVPPPDAGSDASVTGSEAWIRRAAVWTGTQVLVVTIDDSHPVTIHPLDPESGDWRAPVVTSIAGLEGSPDNVVWTGEALVIATTLGPGAIYRPGSTPEVTAIPASGSSAWLPAAALDADVVSVGDRWLDLSSATWHDAEAMPGGSREAASAVAERGRYHLWGGDGCGHAASCVELVDPGPGLIWTPPASQGDAVDEPPTSPSATAALDDARISISVEPVELPGLTMEVGPPVAHEQGWFMHELRLTNTSDRIVRIDDNKTSRVLGDPPAILVAEPSCGYSARSDDPDAPVGAGMCLDVLHEYRAEPGETIVQEWWTARDLPGLVPGGFGTFRYEKSFEYSVGGGDSPVEQHTEVVTITYEITEVAPSTE